MALTKFTGATNTIQSLSDQPNQTDGLTPAQLKTKFDQFAIDNKAFLNDVMSVEIDTLFANRYTKAESDTIAAGIVMGQVPPNSIIDSMLSNATGQIKERFASHETESAYFKKGTGTFLGNTTTLRIDDNWITANTQLFINLTTTPDGIWTWKTYSGYFTITSDSTERIDVVFNWSAVKGGGV